MENINSTAPSIETSTQTGVSSVSIKKPKLTPVFDIFKNAVLIWWKNFEKFLRVYWEGIKPAIIPLIIILVLMILNFIFIDKKVISTPLQMLAGIVVVAGMIYITYFVIRAYMGVYLLVKHNYIGEVKEIFQETKALFWPYFWLSILTIILIILWMLLLIIPGLIFSIFYSFAVYAFFFEGKRGMEAIRRSRALVKGYFWPVLGRLSLLGFIIWIFATVISAPLFAMPEESIGYAVWNAVVQIINFLIGPIALLFSYNIYSDLVKIKQ
ncbi:MAG: hypothetical protein WCT50_01700 [Patescibacteria group bacterium]